MKKFYLFVLNVPLFNISFSAPLIKSISNRYSNATSTLLQFSQESKENLAVSIVSKNGQVIHQQTINNLVGQVIVNSKPTGNYIISISNGQNINTAKKVIL